jgi:5-methylcytosine-specific restriction endonuclease McrA
MVARNASREEKREYMRRWRAAHAEEQQEKKREYYLKHRDRIRAQQSEYRRRNQEADRERSRRYAAAHRAEARDRAKAWYETHNDAVFRERERQRGRRAYAKDPRRRQYARNWQRQNKGRHAEYVRVSQAKRRAAKNGGDGVTAAQWRALVAEHNGRCAYRGCEGPLTMDHRLPLARGGKHEIANILPACRPCNSEKGTLTEEEFRERIRLDAERGIKESGGIYLNQLRNAFRSCGRPRNSSTSFSAGFVPP